MRATADEKHNELLTALENLERAVMVLSAVELMAQDRSRPAAVQQVKELAYELWEGSSPPERGR